MIAIVELVTAVLEAAAAGVAVAAAVRHYRKRG